MEALALEQAQPEDLQEILTLYQEVVASMRARGLYQWTWGEYPSEPLLTNDIAVGQLYILRQSGLILASVCINREQDERYAPIQWQYPGEAGCFHRLAVSPKAQGQGLGRRMFRAVEDVLISWGCDCLRFDTWSPNAKALALYDSMGTRRAGQVYFEGFDEPYVVFEKPLKK